MTNEERLVVLESSLLFPEDRLQKLDQALADQQQQVIGMKHQIKLFGMQIKQLVSQSSDTLDLTPPHY